MKLYTNIAILVGYSMLTLGLSSCNHDKNKSDVIASEVKPAVFKIDTITSLKEFTGNKAVWKHHGNQFTTVEFIPYTKEELQEEEMERSLSGEGNKSYKTSATTSTCSNSFSGSARAAAKLSYAAVSYTTYSTITSLRSSLKTDTYMRSLGISTASTSNRVTDEKQNVNITTCYFYAISRESDEDFHCIIGNSTSASSLINVEVSGLPSSSASSYSSINSVRNYIISYFGTDFCTSSGYTKFSPALTINTLTGSTFFDVDHAAGTVGPTGLRPNSSWEIHPVKQIAIQ